MEKIGTDKIYYNTGNVGIGTDEPIQKLDINGRLQVRGTDFYLGLDDVTNPQTFNRALVRQGDDKLIVNYASDYEQGVQINGNIRLPSLLDNNNENNNIVTINSNGELRKGPLLTDFHIWTKENGKVFYEGGNVGIGTNNPSYNLHVKSDDPDLMLDINSNSTQANMVELIFGVDGNDKARVYYHKANKILGFRNNGDYDKMVILDNGNVGIGTSDPQAKLSLAGEIGLINKLLDLQQGYAIFSDNASSGYGGSTRLWIDGPNNGSIVLGPRAGASILNNIRIRASKSCFEGNIWAKEIKVRTSNPYPDYVFNTDYNLISIEETEQYIKKHKHLKEIPTEKEVIENDGIELGKMNILLLKKVEELTLYIIDLNNKLKEQQKQINELNKIDSDEE